MYVTSFLGGITFAAMILLMQSSEKFTVDHQPTFLLQLMYPDGLILGTAIISVLFIAASIGLIRPASGVGHTEKERLHLMELLASLGFIGIMILLPLLIYPFSPYAAIIIAAVDFAISAIIYYY